MDLMLYKTLLIEALMLAGPASTGVLAVNWIYAICPIGMKRR